MMKHFLWLIAIVLGTITISTAQIPNFHWVKALSDGYGSGAGRVKVDEDRNVYVSGFAKNLTDLDPNSDTVLLKKSKSFYDGFLTKLGPLGTTRWIRKFVGKYVAVVWLEYDGKGFLYVAGTFSDTMDVDPSNNVMNLVSMGKNDVFVAKLDTGGQLIWGKSFGGVENERPKSMKVDRNGNILIAGWMDGKMDADPDKGTFFLDPITNQRSGFVSKLSSMGELLWSQHIGNEQYDQIGGMDIDSNGDVYLTGRFNGTVDFDNDPKAEHKVKSVGSTNIYVLALSASGKFRWVEKFGEGGTIEALQLVLNGKDDIYITGYFTGKCDFDNRPLRDSFMRTSRYDAQNAFVLKLSNGGSTKWAKGLHGLANIVPLVLFVTDANIIYVTGHFSGTVDFDPSEKDTFSLTSIDRGVSGFLLELDENRGFQWVYDFNSTYGVRPHGIETDNAGNLYVAGSHHGISDFDPSSAKLELNTASGIGNFGQAFFLKWGKCVQQSTHDTVTACNSFEWKDGNGRTYFSSGNFMALLTDKDGCDSFATLHLNVETMDMTITAKDSVFTANQTNARYQWLECKGSLVALPGDTFRTYTAQRSGHFAVAITKNACVDTSRCARYFTAHGSIGKSNSVELFPNPTTEEAVLKLSYLGEASVEIINTKGFVYLDFVTQQGSHQLDLSGLPKGLYFLRVRQNGQLYKLKLSKL